MKSIAIIGGGISGLTAAFTLEKRRQAGAPLDYTVFESSGRCGGVVLTEEVDGCLVEGGPDSFLTEKPWAAELCRELELGDQLIGSNDAQRKTYILVNSRLVTMPDGLIFMVPTKMSPAFFSPLFSLGTKARMLREWFSSPRRGSDDESVGSLVSRHYGEEMVNRLADPLLSGVYGGEASQLSVCAVLPRFAEMEEKYGSLARAMLKARKNSRTGSQPLFTSLKRGMQQMVEALVAALPDSCLRLRNEARTIRRENNGFVIESAAGTNGFDAVIAATSAQTAAALLQGLSSELAAELRAIPYSSSVTVTLGYDNKVRAALPAGFGFLVPRSEGKRMMAATFVHNKFSGRAAGDRALIRCFLGGTRDEGVVQLGDEEIARIVREELRQILRITAEPRFVRCYKWKEAMAQYNVGHLDRLRRIEGLQRQLPGVELAGNGFRGIGLPDCVRSGQEAAAKVLMAVGLAQERQAVPSR